MSKSYILGIVTALLLFSCTPTPSFQQLQTPATSETLPPSAALPSPTLPPTLTPLPAQTIIPVKPTPEYVPAKTSALTTIYIKKRFQIFQNTGKGTLNSI